MQLLIGNKITSSWSMRTWIVMREKGIPFVEVNVPMRSPEIGAQRLRARLPSGKVPCLVDGDVTVWETLAILEYLAERFPEKALWPAGRQARAHARAAASEMHAGFLALRQGCPMRMTLRFAPRPRSTEVNADVARITALWNEARGTHTDRAAGPYLYGAFGAADGMYAPVVSRLHSYAIDVDPVSRDYMDAMRATAGWRDWLAGAVAAPWYSPPQDNETLSEDLRGVLLIGTRQANPS